MGLRHDKLWEEVDRGVKGVKEASWRREVFWEVVAIVVILAAFAVGYLVGGAQGRVDHFCVKAGGQPNIVVVARCEG